VAGASSLPSTSKLGVVPHSSFRVGSYAPTSQSFRSIFLYRRLGPIAVQLFLHVGFVTALLLPLNLIQSTSPVVQPSHAQKKIPFSFLGIISGTSAERHQAARVRSEATPPTKLKSQKLRGPRPLPPFQKPIRAAILSMQTEGTPSSTPKSPIIKFPPGQSSPTQPRPAKKPSVPLNI